MTVTAPAADPVEFWTRMGETWTIDSRYDPAGYVAQEDVLWDLLARLDWGTVLDVGCGWGRLAGLLFQLQPGAAYTGIDVSPNQIDENKARHPDAELYVSPILNWQPGSRKWDLVISSEVLMHQPPGMVEATIDRLFAWSSEWVVTVDWYEPGQPGENTWNFAHDYPALFGDRLVSQQQVLRQRVFASRP